MKNDKPFNNKRNMKKLMIAAIMLLTTSAAFAGDSEALKAILKAKTYAEAQELVKANLNQLANDAEKAKAYNKLVDLAMEKVSKEQATITANQMAKQFGQGKETAYDTLGFNKAVYDAINDAILCNEYDQKPNEKGKVKPRFESNNANRLYGLRPNLINAGQAAGQQNNQPEALKFFGMYVESAENPLFKSIDKSKTPDTYLGEVARVAGVYAFQAKDMDRANKYVDVAMKDTAAYKDALNLKLYIMQQGLKTKEDSVKYVNTLRDLYAKDANNEQIFSNLVTLCGSLKMTSEQDKLLNDKLAADPTNALAWALKGQIEMNANKPAEAVECYKKSIAKDGKNVIVLTYLGFCLNAQAAKDGVSKAEQQKLYKESEGYLEQARSLDPNREKANWSYPLYAVYYSLYGAADSRTKEMEALNK